MAESGSAVERRLPCCDAGRRDSLLIHEPCDEIDSRPGSVAAATSVARMFESRRLPDLGGVVCEPAVGPTLTGLDVSGEGCCCWSVLSSSTSWGKRAELVPGGERGGGVGVNRGLSKLKSENNFLFKGEDGRGDEGVGDSVGWPKTRPAAAAAATVPVPTSCRNQGRPVSNHSQFWNWPVKA